MSGSHRHLCVACVFLGAARRIQSGRVGAGWKMSGHGSGSARCHLRVTAIESYQIMRSRSVCRTTVGIIEVPEQVPHGLLNRPRGSAVEGECINTDEGMLSPPCPHTYTAKQGDTCIKHHFRHA